MLEEALTLGGCVAVLALLVRLARRDSAARFGKTRRSDRRWIAAGVLFSVAAYSPVLFVLPRDGPTLLSVVLFSFGLPYVIGHVDGLVDCDRRVHHGLVGLSAGVFLAFVVFAAHLLMHDLFS